MLFLVAFNMLHPKTPNEMREFQVGKSLTHCAESEEPIPEARRNALPGVKLCLESIQERDAAYKPRPGIIGGGARIVSCGEGWLPQIFLNQPSDMFQSICTLA